ncbi:MAG TPA: efflux RND transporter periplasmic adaptor subunit [Candidatus Binataceae bacterium]|jgi:HlyD family secretion protein
MRRFSAKQKRAAIAVVLGVVAALYFLRPAHDAVKYLTAPVTRGPISRVVTATGAVNPVTTVEVGCYVSGPIQDIYADYNTPVKKNQLIAKIDPRSFQVKVDESKAALSNSRAQLLKDEADMAYKKLTSERNAAMVKEGAVSQDTVDNSVSAYHQAVAQIALDKANIEQQQANLHEAQVNLDYTDIISPVDGTIVSRNVDVGQTVAASFQTPTLFLIAKDLTQMQVDANVSESDIGEVREGQPATFTVDAFPNRDFLGTISQVRQAPITVQNVVTYDVVVSVANPELLLKPGMTATMSVVTARRDDVLRVPLPAIRFHPKRRGAATTAVSANNATDGQVSQKRRGARVWIENGGGLKPVVIKTGLDDGNNAELLSGNLHEGDEVVTDEIRTQKAAAGPASPLTQGPPRMR